MGYIGGGYAEGLRGSTDWTRIIYEAGPVPEGVTGGSVILYGRDATSGTAWFDDAEVVELDEPMASISCEPTGRLFAELTPTVRLRARLSNTCTADPNDLLFVVKHRASGPPRELGHAAFMNLEAEIAIPTGDLCYGENQLEATLATTGGGGLLGRSFTVMRRKLVTVSPVEPSPTGVVGIGRPGPLKVRVTVEHQGADGAREYHARLSLWREGRPAGRVTVASVSDGSPSMIDVPVAGSAPGLYDLRCELFGSPSAPCLAADECVVTVVDLADRPKNGTYFGLGRVMMVDDRPFIPVGFYILSSLDGIPPVDQPWHWQEGRLFPEYYVPILDKLADSHFNCVIDYGSTVGGIGQAHAFMDAAASRGIKTIFSVKDLMEGAYWDIYTRNLPWKDLREATRNVVREFREHPSLIGWYVNDEVIQPGKWQGAVNVFRDVRAEDPWHPTLAVHYDYARLVKYREACDIIGTDPYCLTGDIH